VKYQSLLRLAVFVSAHSTAQTKLNFSGTWKVKGHKSNFGSKMDHHEPEIWRMPWDDLYHV